jgi:aminoglycoside phosphotransferase (APT) family kinase protein
MKGLLLDYYQRKFPKLRKLRIHELIRITDGWETEVYSFKLEYENINSQISKELILRIYPGIDAHQKSGNEFDAIRKLYELKYPVPQVFILEQDKSPFKFPFVIMEKINGNIMGEKFYSSNDFQKQFCRLFFNLHSLDWKEFINDPSPYNSKDYLTVKLIEFRNFIENYGRTDFFPLIEWLDRERLKVQRLTFSPIHWDFHPYNIILRKHDNSPFIIDWGAFEVSDFRLDLAWTLLLVSAYSRPQMRKFILKEYELISEAPVEHIEFFDVIACVRRLFTIVVSLNQGANAMGMRPGAEEVIKENLTHIKNVYHLLQERTDKTVPEVEKIITQLEN